MKVGLYIALIGALAGPCVASGGMPLPDSGGILEVDVTVGGQSAGLVVDYDPPGSGTIRAELLSETVARTVKAEVTIHKEPIELIEEFTLDDQFASSDRFGIPLLRGEMFLDIPVRIRSARLTQTETTGSEFETIFTAEMDVLETDGWVSYSFEMGSREMLDLFAIFRQETPALVSCWARDLGIEDPQGILRMHQVYNIVPWSLGNGRRLYEFIFYPQWLYYAGTVEGSMGYPVYHEAFQVDGEPLRIGWLKRNLTGGTWSEVHDLSTSAAVAKLRELAWEFDGDRFSDVPAAATASFGSTEATVEKLAYQIRLADPAGRVVLWQERFTPEGADEPTDIQWMSWNPQPGETESPVYYIDPLEEGNPHRFPGAAGTYEVVVLGVSEGLVADIDRDQRLTLPAESTDDIATNERPLRHWINDDNDIGAVEGDDRPNQGSDVSDWSNATVDSVRDLVDFVPIYVELEEVLLALPEGQEIKLRLQHADQAANVVFTNLPRARAYEFRQQLLDAGFGPNLDQPAGSASVTPVTAAGIDLPKAFTDLLRSNGGGVFLLEGRSRTLAPLVLSIQVGGRQIAECELPLRISPVEEMFRHVDLTQSVTEYDGGPVALPRAAAPSRIDEPPNMPATVTNDRYFVFIHGYNVDGQAARGWHAEVFKRLHAVGSRARFVGVTWHGATGLDYHKAVFQAFQSGDALADALHFCEGSPLVVAAHSLGNVVASHAIQGGGLTVQQYFLINAAVPVESYSSASVTTHEAREMVEGTWREYDQRLLAARWNELFDSADARHLVTWRDCFDVVRLSGIGTNLYSSQEDVVADMDGVRSASVLATVLRQGFNVSRGAWKAQELVKGVPPTVSLAEIFMERGQGGWGFNSHWYIERRSPGPPGQGSGLRFVRRTPSQTLEISAEELKVAPFHENFLAKELHDADWNVASSKAALPNVRYDLLARAIPAASNAAAANSIDEFGTQRNYDMATRGVTNGPLPTKLNAWRHSDFKDVALVYTYRVYDAMVSRGELR